MSFMVGAFAASALAVTGLLLYIAVRFRSPSVNMHVDIHRSISIALSRSSEMLHEGGPRRHTYITTSSTCFSATLSSQSVCNMCRLAPFPRKLAVDLSRWIAKHKVDNRGGASGSQCKSACLTQRMHQGVYPGALCTVQGISPLSFTRRTFVVAPRRSEANRCRRCCTQVCFNFRCMFVTTHATSSYCSTMVC